MYSTYIHSTYKRAISYSTYMLYVYFVYCVCSLAAASVLKTPHSHELQVFTSLSLFSILIGPLNAYPWVINGMVEAWVSLKRVQRFLNLKETSKLSYYQPHPLDHAPSIEIDSGSFSWQHHCRHPPGDNLTATSKEMTATGKETTATDKEMTATDKEMTATGKEMTATGKEMTATDKTLASVDSKFAAEEQIQSQFKLDDISMVVKPVSVFLFLFVGSTFLTSLSLQL